MDADGGFGGTAEKHLGHLVQFAEASHHRIGVLGRHQQVQVADGLPHAAHTPGRGSLHHPRHLSQRIQHRPGQRPGHSQRGAPCASLQRLDPGQHLGLAFGPHPFDAAQATLPRCFLQCLNAGDAEFLPEQRRLAGADVGDPEQRHDASGHLGLQFIVGPQAACAHQFVYLSRQRLADTGNRLQFPRLPDLIQRPAQSSDVLRCPPVGHNAVVVLPLDGQDIGHRREDLSHLLICHPSPPDPLFDYTLSPPLDNGPLVR